MVAVWGVKSIDASPVLAGNKSAAMRIESNPYEGDCR
jgi:hypothetical protein